jgi:hypothetical protein
MEQEKNYLQQQGKDGAMVVPLDELRSVSYATKAFISGEFPGSAFWPIASGRAGYLTQVIVTNLSGTFPIILKWADAATALSGHAISGNAAIAHLMITSGNANPYGNGSFHVTYNPALGPYTSGICVVSGGAQLGGLATAVIEIDPQKTQ